MTKLVGRWQASLPVKITFIASWGLLIIGFVLSLVLLGGVEQQLKDRYAGISDQAVEKVSALLQASPAAGAGSIETALRGFQQQLGFAGAELKLGNRNFFVGHRPPGAYRQSHILHIHPPAAATAELTVFYPDLKQAVAGKRKNVLLTLGLLFLLFGLSLALVLQTLLTKPFVRMVKTAQAFSNGDINARFDTKRRDEFGFLAKFINKVLDQLLARQNDLKNALEQVRRSENALFEEKERAEVTLHSIGDGVITSNAEGIIEYLNPTAEELSGWSLAEARGRPVKEVMRLITEDTREVVADPIEQSIATGEVMELADNIVLVRQDGTEIAIADSAAPIRDNKGHIVGAVMVFHDVEQTRRLARQLSYQASHDALTGLYNRRAFEQHLQRALDLAVMDHCDHALCYLDLDQFKIVNDTCGHVAGDELLRQVAGLLQVHIRDSDVLARLGGDEFGVLLQHCGIGHARAVAEKLRRAIQEFRFLWKDHVFETGVSIGLVSLTPDARDINQVMSYADIALYAAKEKGRNRLHEYQPDDNELKQRQGEMQWVSKIRKAIDEDRFELHYQPIVLLGKSETVDTHFEVLVRMVDESGELVPPMTFIPAAERYDLMPTIDRWVVRQTLRFLNDNMEFTDNCLCAINLSGQTLCDDDFLDFVVDELESLEINPAHVCFEITETAAIANLNKAIEFVNTLKLMGCRFALDDFGSGLSSFAYLKNLPVDFLKIDGSFIRDITTDPINRAMVEAINRIGHVMKIHTIAEFVENDDILNLLQQLGLNYAQGYGIAKPRSMDVLARELEVQRLNPYGGKAAGQAVH